MKTINKRDEKMSIGKLNYLTGQEFTDLTRLEIDTQIALGLRSCEKISDVLELLSDVREHERYMMRKEMKK